MKTIIVTGTPGTGKTTVAKGLAKGLDLKYIDANIIIKKHKLSDGYDKKRKSRIIGIKKLNKALIKEISMLKKDKGNKAGCNGIVIDSHLSHYLPKRYVDMCIVTRCNLKELKRRLTRRKYSAGKVRENMDAEIFDVCLAEAKEKGHKTIEIDTTKGIKQKLNKMIKNWQKK